MISAVQKKSNDIDSIEQDISSFLNNSKQVGLCSANPNCKLSNMYTVSMNRDE